MARIVQSSVRLVREPVSHELLALIREQELIHRWRPDFNKQGQPTRTQPAYLCISGGAAPNAFLARQVSQKAAQSFGPISGTGRLREAIVAINHAFELRDCPDKTGFGFSNQLQLFDDPRAAGCIRFELGSCPGPCASLCNSKTYSNNADRVTSFLEGTDVSILNTLEQTMTEAANSSAFETAAIIRDYLHDLKWLDRRMAGLRGAQSILNGVIPVPARRRGRASRLNRRRIFSK